MLQAYASPLRFRYKISRGTLLSVVSITAYLATVMGAGTNIIYLGLAVSALAIAWPAVSANRTYCGLLILLSVAVLWGAIFNGVATSLRSATPYIGMLVAFALLAQDSSSTNHNRLSGIAFLYGAGLIQIASYLVLVLTSPHYTFLYSLDEVHRFSVGWLSIICFFHMVLPAYHKRGLPRSLRYLGIVFWLVPLLVVLNSSRSELLMIALLAAISLYMRGKVLLVSLLIAGVVALPFLANHITGIERASDSIDEVFNFDLETVADAYVNYRAFENLMMVKRIATSGPFGCGLGCEVPFSVPITLQGRAYKGVTVFHNGYLTVLLHFGLVGVVFIALLIRKLARAWKNFTRASRRRESATLQAKALRFAVLLLLLGTGMTTGGFMSSYDVLVLLLPLCVAARVVQPYPVKVPRRTTARALLVGSTA
jgi:hypothetical protein